MKDHRTLERIEKIRTYQIAELKGEIWVPIRGYEQSHMVSSFGRVKSIFRHSVAANGKIHTYPEKLLSPQIDPFGYHRAPLRKNNKQKYHSVHRLVAQHFIPNQNQLPQVNHKNGNKSDNKVTNLEWCTASQNKKHAYDELNHARMRGERNGMTKLTADKLKEIKEVYHRLKSYNKTGEVFGISNTHVWRIVKHKTWEHYEY